MSAPVKQATIADLYKCDGKAELINGRIVEVMTGMRPNEVAANVYVSLREYARQTRAGRAFTDGMGFTVPVLSSGRESFSPDAAFHPGPFVPHSKRFMNSAPSFAVEVRSENDYGASAEREMAEKRDDYFEAGTVVVWDVDEDAGTVTAYRFRQQTAIYRRGQFADAEPALPGWRISVEDVFAEEGIP